MINRLFLLFLFVLIGPKAFAEVPNILFVISDDQSYPHASAYNCRGINTPGFDRVAKEGVLFHNAISGSPGCSPSRASVLTGRYHWMIEHAGTHASTFNKKYSTFPDLLEKSGYWVGYTGKGWGPGKYKDGGFNRNPAGPIFSSKKKNPKIKGISSTDYTENFNVFMSNKPKGKPFCFWLGGHEPHRVFEKGIGLRKGKNYRILMFQLSFLIRLKLEVIFLIIMWRLNGLILI